jgi:hypothetical protein
VRFSPVAPEDEAPRPHGIGLTALLLSALAVTSITGLILLTGGAAFRGPQHLLQLLSGGMLLAASLFVFWSYWKGRNWARVLILIGSFWIVASEISALIDNGGSAISLMSHPVRFLEFGLAAVLLYWLNTSPLRAWFNHAPPTAADLMHSRLSGKLCTAVENNSSVANTEWRLTFEHDAELTLNCPWRVVLDDNLAFASDPGPEIPMDEQMPRKLLQNLRVTRVRVVPRTSDLSISFEMGFELQSWSSDPQLLQWKFSDPTLTVVADAVGLISQAIAAGADAEEPEDNEAND